MDETVTTSVRALRAPSVHRLMIAHGPAGSDIGRIFMLGPAPVKIGRAPELEISLASDGKASREHASLEPSGEAPTYTVRDLESRNGTYVDGRRVSSAELHDGAVLRVGAHLMLFQILDGAACARLLDETPPVPTLVGTSHQMQLVHKGIRTAAPAAFPVLILGETGVGKELVATAIHDLGARSGRLVALNCATLPEQLVESELFGHSRGAFTGAVARGGLFAEAESGTLFLDEIGEMPLELQAKLLRVLATGEVRAVGADKAQHLDVRVVAATNVDLREAVEAGDFRADLYARLRGFVIDVPSLRERREDVLPIAAHFLAGTQLSADAAEALLLHDWTFNVRELEQAIAVARRAAEDRPAVDLEHLPDELRAPFVDRHEAASVVSKPSPLLGIRRDLPPSREDLEVVLGVYDGSVSRTAAFFRKHRRQIYRWARRHGIDVTRANDADDEDPESAVEEPGGERSG